MDWVSKGMFDRIRIETSGRFLQASVAELAARAIPQEWILDVDHGDGAGLELLQKYRGDVCRIVLRQRVVDGLRFESTRIRFPNWPIYVGAFPSTGDGIWFSRVDTYSFSSDQKSDVELERMAQEAEVGIHTEEQSNKVNRYAVVSWDGKVTLCNRDEQLQHIIGEVNHSHFHELWSSIRPDRAKGSTDESVRDFCPACGQVHTLDLG